MFFVYFLLWIVFNGQVTVEIVLFGIAVAAVMELFICKFMGYRRSSFLNIVRNCFRGFQFVLVLLLEILKANFQVMSLILTAKYEIEPVIINFKTDLQSEAARVALANCITLTPGTITVTLEGDKYCVHCLDKELAVGIEDSVFVRLLRKMEGR